MKNEILKIKPPKEYREGLFAIEEGIDNIPEYIDYRGNGYSPEEAKRMDLLVRIEMLRHNLEMEKHGNEATAEEVEEAENYIQDLIYEYNNM